MKRVLLLIFLVSCRFFAQEKSVDILIPDSIQSKTYFQLYELFSENYQEHPDQAYLYANAYLAKGKVENRHKFIAYGYFLMSRFHKNEKVYLKYTDSIIQLAKDRRASTYKIRGYLLKGDFFLRKGRYLKAWENYEIASQAITGESKLRTLYLYNRSIGLLKSRIGKHKEAIRIFRECYEYASKEELDDRFEDMLFLAREFNQLKKLDSALRYNNQGIKATIDTKNKYLYNLFVLNSGVTYYHKKAYQKAIDSISKILPDLNKSNEKQELITSYLYLGKSYAKINLKDKSIHYLEKMDSIVQIQKDINLNIIQGYEILINYFKELNDVKKESTYLQKQFKIDSILHINTTNILQKTIRGYNTLLMISEKDTKLVEKRKSTVNDRIAIVMITLLFIVSIGIMIYLYKDLIHYRKSFRAVVSYTNKVSEGRLSLKKPEKGQLDDLKISPESVQKILKGIKDFEGENRYLNKKYTLNVLAKELKTNSTYLSKIINIYKEKNFSNYLHDLRVGYAIERLRDDEKFRRYSIKGISEEVGFKTSESFAKAFHKKTGIYPSSFIKKLKHT
ncbi:helix-turn-helix domain-containing protein [Aquimarina algiphila]|uniref:helix-turn-helix domain-containing protein n=1 Tax=Aquimarina algiphila TaxID=2047982 RepID=UPI00232E0F0F|nr:helix-turn-helix domain-containing protein [Aquimarina algiphila]